MTKQLYYPIGQVAEMLGVNPSLLRYWETEFPSIKPHKNKKGTRFYTESDIELLRHIYHLTRDCGYTLDGVKEQLRHTAVLDDKMQIARTLTEAKQLLIALKECL